MRNASAAEAPAAKLRNERRDAEGTLKSLSCGTRSWGAITHLVRDILSRMQPRNQPQKWPPSFLHSPAEVLREVKRGNLALRASGIS
jgi:hypothetical protein